MQHSCGGLCAPGAGPANMNCVACGAGYTLCRGACVRGACVPANDRPLGALPISLLAPSQTIRGDTTAATNQSGCGTGPDVYYTFLLTAREVVYADTFGSATDTRLAFAPASGTGYVAGTCVDDACSSQQSQIAAVLEPGYWFIIVGGDNDAAVGPFTLRVQHLRVGNGTPVRVPSLTGQHSFPGAAAGTGVLTPSCAGATGPEITHWFVTCPSFPSTPFTASTCGSAANTVIEQRSAASSSGRCDDDTCGLQSNVRGTFGPGAGLHAIDVDTIGTSGGSFTLNLLYGRCPAGQPLCTSGCRDALNDPRNCGSCGVACTGSTAFCVQGACASRCGGARPDVCSGVCVNTRTDTANCGACGRTCLPGGVCNAGVCGCPPGNEACSGACVNVLSSNNNCGRCSNACNHELTPYCNAGTCAATCSYPFVQCGDHCVHSLSDARNCGTCGHVCSAATPYCIAGRCAAACTSPNSLIASTGVCTNTRTDVLNCGASGRVCAYPFSGAVSCVAGMCTCKPGATTCGSGVTAYCAATSSDALNCGACGRRCSGSTPYCQHGSCVAACSAPFTRCQNGCVNLETFQSDCGTCANRCGGSTPYCVNGRCSADCRMRAVCANACVDTRDDLANCGGCATVPPAPPPGGAVVECIEGRYENVSRTCASGRTQCYGACVDLSSDSYNCGGCDRVCVGDPASHVVTNTCVAGACTTTPATCAPPYGLCGETCVDLETDSDNCGRCGDRCCSLFNTCDNGGCNFLGTPTSACPPRP